MTKCDEFIKKYENLLNSPEKQLASELLSMFEKPEIFNELCNRYPQSDVRSIGANIATILARF